MHRPIGRLIRKDYCLIMDLTLGSRLRELDGPVLITGHTGFKGCWLTLLLEHLGVPVIGLSLTPQPDSLYARIQRRGAITESYIDIRNFNSVLSFMKTYRPAAVIHMAAQPLVLESYKTPRETFETNVMGTVNVLESSFLTDSVQAAVVVTTDKVYRNDNSNRSFIESDPMQGKDPYSASKVGSEATVSAWQQLSKFNGGPRVISVRAGNVIGGGDWAENRIMPELIRGFLEQSLVTVRNPLSTRPWQHVLDPLRGYVMALEAILNGVEFDTLNFGPNSPGLSVGDIVSISRESWPSITSVEFSNTLQSQNIEAVSLHLDSKRARDLLGWNSRWGQEESVIATIEWWDKIFNKSVSPKEACEHDIDYLLSV
jgi:CDP-glucose 4,6-dehydratase